MRRCLKLPSIGESALLLQIQKTMRDPLRRLRVFEQQNTGKKDDFCTCNANPIIHQPKAKDAQERTLIWAQIGHKRNPFAETTILIAQTNWVRSLGGQFLRAWAGCYLSFSHAFRFWQPWL